MPTSRSPTSDSTVLPARPAPAVRGWRGRLGAALGTLKFRVVLVAVLSALITGLVSTAYVTHETQREALRQLRRQQGDDVELVAGVLGSKIDQVQRVLRLLAQGIQPAMLATPQGTAGLLAGGSEALRYFDTVQIAGLDGKLLVNQSFGKPLLLGDISPAQREVIGRTLRNRTEIVSPPMPGLKDELPAVVFTVPLVAADGRVFGVVAGGLKLHGQGLLPASLDLPGSFDSTLVVHDHDGIVLFHSNPALVLRHVGTLPGLAEQHAAWVDSGALVIAESDTRIEGDFIVSTAGMLTPQWIVARITPKRVALAPMEAAQRRSWAVTGITMAVCAALAGLLIAWMTHPITLLRRRAVLVHADAVEPRAGWPTASGEVGELVVALRNAAIERSRLPAQQAMVRQLRAILNHAPVGIFMARNSRLELIGRQACQMLGYETNELLGRNTGSIFGSEQAFHALQDSMSRELSETGFFDMEMLLHRKDGSDFWAHVVARSVSIGDEDFNHIWIFEDITLARKAQEALAWKATHDALTLLVNRREFELQLARALTSVQPPRRERLALLFIDLDYFKEVNDGAGHAAGDTVLFQVARLLEAQVGPSETVCRLGGDEFAVLLPASGERRARQVAEKIRAAVDALHNEFQGQQYRLGTSIGFVVLDASFEDVAAALSAADSACYAAKRGGRNCVVQYNPAGMAV